VEVHFGQMEGRGIQKDCLVDDGEAAERCGGPWDTAHLALVGPSRREDHYVEELK
jgi:hypothetical protein